MLLFSIKIIHFLQHLIWASCSIGSWVGPSSPPWMNHGSRHILPQFHEGGQAHRGFHIIRETRKMSANRNNSSMQSNTVHYSAIVSSDTPPARIYPKNLLSHIVVPFKKASVLSLLDRSADATIMFSMLRQIRKDFARGGPCSYVRFLLNLGKIDFQHRPDINILNFSASSGFCFSHCRWIFFFSWALPSLFFIISKKIPCDIRMNGKWVVWVSAQA